jgi:hypothetical protein
MLIVAKEENTMSNQNDIAKAISEHLRKSGGYVTTAIAAWPYRLFSR